jgi:two-component system response regulator AtoC
MIERILIVDDDPLMRKFISEVCRRLKKEIMIAEDGEEASLLLQSESFDLIISDVKMPRKNGIELLATLKKLQPSCLMILMTAHGTIESAVEAMKLGAFNYLLKPFSPDSLEALIQNGETHLRLIKENKWLKSEILPELIAESPALKRILKDLEKIAKSQASIFITGESGTGKEVIAAAIHKLSNRNNNPFIKVNCAAIPETLIESEFFGHEKGAFTGAQARKIGRFEIATQGTLLLDEVTEIPLLLQPKLLRAIQEQEFERVGGTKSIQVDIRFIATSNRMMQEAIETKIFREDLYYRLNVVPIHIPPLRERPEDILPLAEYFLKKACIENHKALKIMDEKAKEKLLSYAWPGNVRELANIIERIVVLDFDPIIQPSHIYLNAPHFEKKESAFPVGTSLHEMEKRLIFQTLEANHQNRTKTAAMLKISARTLRNKLYEYEASTPEL